MLIFQALDENPSLLDPITSYDKEIVCLHGPLLSLVRDCVGKGNELYDLLVQDSRCLHADDVLHLVDTFSGQHDHLTKLRNLETQQWEQLFFESEFDKDMNLETLAERIDSICEDPLLVGGVLTFPNEKSILLLTVHDHVAIIDTHGYPDNRPDETGGMFLCTVPCTQHAQIVSWLVRQYSLLNDECEVSRWLVSFSLLSVKEPRKRKRSNVPEDIASGPEVKPVQPTRTNFPKTMFGQKQRSFSSGWYAVHPWIEYSESVDAIFCFPCRFFSLPSPHINSTFTLNEFSNWKKATGHTGSLCSHSTTDVHKSSMLAWNEYQKRTALNSEHSSVDTILQKVSDTEKAENRHFVKSICEVLLLTAFQNISQRGHDESDESLNRGNFLEVLTLLSKHDEIISRKLQGPQNGTYTSAEIQNELIEIMAEMVTEEICEEIREAGCFSVLMDESRDVRKKEQISLVIRYVKKTVEEAFLSFRATEGLTADALYASLKKELERNDLDKQCTVGQGYDGANVMSGELSGVQTRFIQDVARALYVHCKACHC
eukprot:Lithocolla_globosa_v1_NODE_583_length_3681_cov_15.345284.p1 type:complete len:543 gc:universal NODE_583_length_3681_cov_15.345284:3050-1422(-)